MSKNSVAIIGLGYVGLPLAILLKKKKFKVVGFDSNVDVIKKIKLGKSYISDVSDKEISKLKSEKIYSPENIQKISKVNYIIICLPTPLKNNKPDMRHIEKAFKLFLPYLRTRQTIILESSVYPGATKKIFFEGLSRKFDLGKNFFLTYSPERIDPGKSQEFTKTKLEKIPKLISGYSPNCLKKIKNFYSKIFDKLHECETLEIAEFSKLFENTYRSVNISLVNEIKMFANKMNINFHNVIEAASTKPFGFTKFIPGPGTGGHCIPIDPIFISWIAKKYKFKTKFIELSAATNQKVTLWTINKIKSCLKKIKNKNKILLLGLTYKKNVCDTRESASIKIFKKIRQMKNTRVDFYDGYVNSILIDKKLIKSINFSYKKLKNYDYIVILTDHSNLNYKLIKKFSKKIIDTRGVYKFSTSDKILHI